MRRTITGTAAALAAVAALLIPSGTAQAAKPAPAHAGHGQPTSVFAWHLGDAFIAKMGFPHNSQAKADNGDVVTVVGTGAFSQHPSAASGGGTFVHHVAATNLDATGTFQVRKLISFTSYGSGVPQGTPPNFFGGKLVLRVEVTPDLTPRRQHPAVLTIYCALGKVPSGVEEGMILDVKKVIDFDEIVSESGANVYVKLA
jgi:hypothetical protein